MCAFSSLHRAVVHVNADYYGAFLLVLDPGISGIGTADNSDFVNKTVTAVNVVRPRSFGTSFLSPSVN